VVIDCLTKGALPLAGFVTAVYEFERMTEAFAYIDAHADSVRKIVVAMPG
jgi:Zn-dependent alcohol dehydrogenase